MTDNRPSRVVTVSLTVAVIVDPDDMELIERIAESTTMHSVEDVVVCEVESHLESVSYVMRVVVTRN